METKLFITNKSQAVRLPKSVTFPDGVTRVTIVTLGKSRLVTPADAVWDDFFITGDDGASSDFMASRDQPETQPREEF